MQWHLVISNLFVRPLLAVISLFMVGAAPCALAVDESRLWLPSSYEHYQADLVRAAQAAEDLDRCSSVLDGALDLEKSKPNQPIYRILCRQSDGRSYNEMVDGVTFETLTTIIVREKVLTAEEQALKSVQAQAELVKRTADAWDRCEQKVKESTRLMIDLVLVTHGRPESTTAGPDERVFVVLFDAKSIRGEELHYKAMCTASLNDPIAKVVIKRRDAPQ